MRENDREKKKEGRGVYAGVVLMFKLFSSGLLQSKSAFLNRYKYRDGISDFHVAIPVHVSSLAAAIPSHTIRSVQHRILPYMASMVGTCVRVCLDNEENYK